MHRRRPLAAVVSLALATPLLLLAPPASAAPPARPYDFNGDGLPELVVGAPSLTVLTHAQAGGVAVLPGSASGPASTAQVVTAATPGVVGAPDGDEAFGAAFASGDFDGDGFADLAIGRPVAYVRYEGAGAVTVVYGSAKGLTGARSLELLEPGGPQFDTGFGYSLAAQDVDGDGQADLAVGAPYDYGVPGDGTGAVAVFRGAEAGLSQTRASVLRGRAGFDNGSDDGFGTTLAFGDLDQDGRPDLVVGSSGARPRGGTGYPGGVSACYGTAQGLSSCSRLAFDQSLAESRSIDVGNVSGSSRPEIVLGVAAYDDPLGGTVQTLSLDGPRGSTTVRRRALTQDSPGVRGTAEKGDDFGQDVALGDLDADGYADLVVGAPGEDKNAGRVTIVYGGAAGYRATGGLFYDQDTKGVPGTAEKDDRFSVSVALVDHDGNGHLDLSVGARGENDGDGAVTILRGSGASFTTKAARTVTLKQLGYPTPQHAAFGSTLGR